MYTHVVEYEIKLKLWVEIEEIFAKMAYVFPALPLLILAKLEEWSQSSALFLWLF